MRPYAHKFGVIFVTKISRTIAPVAMLGSFINTAV
jgi:hypothetical protein